MRHLSPDHRACKILVALLILAMQFQTADAYRACGPCVESDDPGTELPLRVDLGTAPPWLKELDSRIKKAWSNDLKVTGPVFCTFTVKCDGSITDFVAKRPNGEMNRLRKEEEAAARSIIESSTPIHSKTINTNEKAVAFVRFNARKNCLVSARVFSLQKRDVR